MQGCRANAGLKTANLRDPTNNPGGRLQMEAYCVKCKAKKTMVNPTAITMKNGKPATTGTCPTCGTKMFKIGK